MTITNDQFQTYERQGYIIVEDLIPSAELAALSAMTHRLLDGGLKPEMAYDGKIPAEFYTFWEPGLEDREEIPRRDRIRLMSRMAFHHPYFWKFACHPNIYAVISALLDDGVQLFGESIFRKPAHHGIDAAPHQDMAFWPGLEPRSLKCWLAIDPAAVENGCMYFIPASHRKALPHEQHPVQKWILSDEQWDLDRQVPIELSPGSAVFFDSGLIHRSHPNRSDFSRRSWAANYVAEHVEHLEPWTSEYGFKLIPPAG